MDMETIGGHKNSIHSTFMILVNFDVMKTYFDIEGGLAGLADKYGRTDTCELLRSVSHDQLN